MPRQLKDILFGSVLPLQLFPVFRVSRAGQKVSLEFSKDGSADLGNTFTDGSSAHQPVILQGGVCLSYCQVSHCFCQFQSNYLGLAKTSD